MTLLKLLPQFILSATVTAFVVPSNELVVTRKFFPQSNIKYTSQHDIVNIDLPLSCVNFDDNELAVFFAEADVNDEGQREYKGLYQLKNGTANKILENGHNAAAFIDDSKTVYIGASDGVYVYDSAGGTIKKYGSLSDNIKQIEADNQTSTLYFLTEDNELFFIADEGTKKNKVEDVKDTKEFVIDFKSNIYYYDSKKDMYVFNQNGVKKFDGIPKRDEIKLIKPMFILDEGVFALIDNTLYFLDANGTSEKSPITFKVKPTAYAPETAFIQYYALDKNMYEFNLIEIMESETELQNFLNGITNNKAIRRV